MGQKKIEASKIIVSFKIQRRSNEIYIYIYIYIYTHRRTRSKGWLQHDKHEDKKRQ